MQMLVLSYLPERGIHRFPPMITPDIEFEAEWHGWVYALTVTTPASVTQLTRRLSESYGVNCDDHQE